MKLKVPAMGFSIFENTYDVYSKGDMTLESMYQVLTLQRKLSSCITTTWRSIDNWPYRVQAYRVTGNTLIKQRELPAVVPFGVTAPNDRKIIQMPSGLFCVDLDYGDNKSLFDKSEPNALKAIIAAEFSSAALAFISPSGRGLKVLHKILPLGEGNNDHIHVSRIVFEHFEMAYRELGLNIDFKCKDWNRLCYLSYDREAYYNKNSLSETITVPQMVLQPIPVLEDKENGYQLSNLKKDKDQICPRCMGGQHRDESFTYYVDQYGNRLDGCGVCSRTKCNANIKPWEVYPSTKWKYMGKVRG